MPDKMIWRLILLWLVVLPYRLFLFELVSSLIVLVVDSNRTILLLSRFVGISLFPILYALLVWRLFWRYRMSYRAVEGMLYLLLSAAVVFALSSVCWTVPVGPRLFPFLLLAPLTLLEVYGCGSFICIFIAFFFLGFGRRRSPAQ